MMTYNARVAHPLLGGKARLDRICRRLMPVLVWLMVLLEYGAGAIIIRVKPTGSDGNNGGSWPSAKLTVDNAMAAASTGDEIWVAAGVYHERLIARNGVAMYGGFAGTETDRNQRDYRIRATILDGDRGGTVVSFEIPLGGNDTRIDGFTVRNGSGNQGGGLVCVCATHMLKQAGNIMSNGRDAIMTAIIGAMLIR